VLKERWHKILHWEHIGITLITLVTLIMHFSIIMLPEKPLFDEAFYSADGKSIVDGQGTLRTEHPPLGKFFVATGILLFGDNAFGWRFFSVVAGTAILILFYLICRELSLPKIATQIAVYLLAFENITFVQASVGMLDVYMVAFSLGTFYLYLKGKYLPAAIFAALSVMAKLNGALVVPVIALHWVIARRDRPGYFIPAMLFAPVAFFLILPLVNFPIEGEWQNPFRVTEVMLNATQSLTFANVDHEVRQVPWDWFIHWMRIAYWFKPNYWGNLSLQIWALGIPTAVYLFLRGLWKNNGGKFGLSWFIGTYLLWMPLVWITDRVTYGFYVYPTVGALCLGLAIFFNDTLKLGLRFKGGKLKWVAFGLVVLCMVGHMVSFVLMSPVFTRWF